jgi:hypothetical protein
MGGLLVIDAVGLCSQDSFCPIIFGRPFLHTIGARFDLRKKRVYIKCVGKILHLTSLNSLINIWIENCMLKIKYKLLLV